ncbi:MAG: dienelactone hydrolase family protein [Promethearchaeota archaeon]
MSLKEKLDVILIKLLKGPRKKILILVLSVITALFLILPFIKPVSVLYNVDSNNPLGVESVNFEMVLSEGKIEHIVGQLYRTKSVMHNLEDPLNPKDAYAPGVVLLHDWNWGVGKESLIKYSIEIARRGFVVLAIDLPGQGHTTGTPPALVPSVDLEPYVINASINYLRSLPYVNSSSIGIVGFGYGGSAAGLSAGVLKTNINATIIVNGFLNFTDWLINNETGILKSNNIEFDMNETIIHLKSINGIQITPADMADIIKLYSLVRGNPILFEEAIIPNTTNLNRTVLKKYDAVEVLGDATPNSLLFIHSLKDSSYGYTNQSGQGYNASINGATYCPIDWKRDLTDNDNATWIILNFLKQKLMLYELPNKGTVFATYSQSTDSLGFTTDGVFGSMPTLLKSLIFLFGAAIPVCFIINIIYYSKKFEVDRAMQEIPEDERLVRFTGGNYKKVFTGIVFQLIFASLLLWIVGNGFESSVSILSITAIYYIAFYFTMIYIPDEAEIKIQRKIPLDQPLKHLKYYYETSKKEKLITLIITIGIVGGSCFIFGQIIPPTTNFKMPVDGPSIILLCSGIVLILSALVFIRNIIIKSEGKISWTDFGLDFYSLIKSGTCGISSGLSIFIIFNHVVFWIRYPFNLGARTDFFAFVLMCSIIFAVGFHLWSEIILRKTIFYGKSTKMKILAWIIATLIGIGLSILAGWCISLRFLDGGIWISINLPFIFGLLCGAAYIIARLIEIISAETGILTATIYTSIVVVSLAAIFIRI